MRAGQGACPGCHQYSGHCKCGKEFILSTSGTSPDEEQAIQDADRISGERKKELHAFVSLDTVNVDGVIDPRGIRLIGHATRQADGKFNCLADVDGTLCLVEIKIIPTSAESIL